MPPKKDIGWDHATPVGGNKRIVMCNYCGKIVHGGITRLKQHVARISGQVDKCPKVSEEISKFVRQHLNESANARDLEKRKKAQLIESLRDDSLYEGGDNIEDVDEYDDDDTEGMSRLERRQLKNAMKESRHMATMDEDRRRRSVSERGRFANVSQFKSGSHVASGSKRPTPSQRSFSVRENVEMPASGGDPFMFRPKTGFQKKVKDMFNKQNAKKVGKAISKFFLFSGIAFNAADSGPYYQTMIDTIADAGPGIKGPSGYQISNSYLDEEVKELEMYIGQLKQKWPDYGCTIMCDGWSSKTNIPIINFMIYCDRNMIYHTLVDTTNQSKTAAYIFSLMDKVVEEVGESNVVQVVTDNEPNFKAAGRLLMEKRHHLFWTPCAAHCIDLMLEDIGQIKTVKATLDKAKKITSFIYNSQKVVNLMRTYTQGRDLLRPGITRFATQFIAIESLIRYQSELKRMCTSSEWGEFNREKSRRSISAAVSDLILTDRFWKNAILVTSIMEPLVRVLKIVDQDKKPTMSIIYEAMDRAKFAIKASVKKDYQKYWDVIDYRWESQLHRHLHAAAYFLNPAFQYSHNFSNHPEVRLGLKEVIKRLEPDVENQAKAISEIKNYADARGEFGQPLTKKAITTSLPAEWWYHYGEEAPHLRRIAIKVLSQTCSSLGCERNWSTWSLIHTKLRNRLAMNKLHKLVFVHYNLRLRVRNIMYTKQDEDYYNPIDLNNIFEDDDILGDWIREKEAPVLGDDLSWLNEGNQNSDEGQRGGAEEEEEDNTPIPSRSKQSTLNKKGKGIAQRSQSIFPSSSSSSDDDDDDDGDDDDDDDDNNDGGGNDDNDIERRGGGDYGGDSGGGGGHSSLPHGMSWAEGNSQYYATQDTDHGYRPGIDAQRQHLARLTEISSGDDYSSGYNAGGLGIDDQLRTMGIGYQDYGGHGGYGQPYHTIGHGYGPHGDPGYSTSSTGSRGHLPPVRQLERSTSTSSGGYYDRAPRRYRDTSASTATGDGGGYSGYDLGRNYDGSSSSSVEYRGFGFYQGTNPVNPSQSQNPDYGSSSQSSQPAPSEYGSILFGGLQFPYPYNAFNNQGNNDDDFEPPRHSIWH